MSILIKGMEMPQHGDVLVVREYNGKTYIKHKGHCGFEGRLIELPPHGRLIDIKSVEDGKFTTVGNDYQRWWNDALDSVVDNAPTVIEAEGR